MRRWETLTALVAVVAASAGALPIPGRWFYTLAGVVLLLAVGASRLVASLTRGRAAETDAAERARRIREQRPGRR